MRDVVYEMEVTLEELYHGGVKKVRIWSEVPSEGGGGGQERVARDIEIGLTTGMSTVREHARHISYGRYALLHHTPARGSSLMPTAAYSAGAQYSTRVPFDGGNRYK